MSTSTKPDASALNALWQWTFTPEAIAPCFVRDVLEMKSNAEQGNYEFYWLGRVPCRTVKLVGMVVAVSPYESKVQYALDDGTGVIECQHRPPPPAKGQQDGLKPVVPLGRLAVITGRIVSFKESRRILVDEIVRCASANDEPRHWLDVQDKHENYYFLDQPFVIPERPPPLSQPPSTPQATIAYLRPETPSVVASSSPVKTAPATPTKLRHPSRLRSRELTDNTFRIYVKHYMTNVGDPIVDPNPATPTKLRSPVEEQQTPRPIQQTPRSSHETIVPSSGPSLLTATTEPRGFTLSHLRRVPELALFARRVVKAEAKRRLLAEYQQAKAERRKPRLPPKLPPEEEKSKRRQKAKRLFGWALKQMVQDGDAVEWEGAVRALPLPPTLNMAGDVDMTSNTLWRFEASSAGGDSTMFSLAGTSTITELGEEDDDGDISDAPPNEDAFLPLTPAFLASYVEIALKALTARKKRSPNASELHAYLRRSDDMWRNLTAFAVEDALDGLMSELRVRTVGDGRWQPA
ncbi:Stn1 domain-containing protein [Mycena kentingensis (nom. inval.)]|nr:Stn1 domain-containing protein [Mycena kentingensis (nom. inval.)]